jgi:DNA helicase HerA-like ATPase
MNNDDMTQNVVEIANDTQVAVAEPQIATELAKLDLPEEATHVAIEKSLVNLGFINFDVTALDNNTSGALVSEERRKDFRRDVYVGIKDAEQKKEFLGRVVEGPFYTPHEVGADSAITRTTVLHPERTRFRPSYYVSGTIEILGELLEGERVVVTPTRPRPYSEICIFPEDRLAKMLEINGDFHLGLLMGYSGVNVFTDSNNKNFIPRNIGVFGTVGSGKSNTTQVIMEEALKAGWAVVTIDVEGEYVRMNEETSDEGMKKLLAENGNKPEGIKDFQVYVPITGHSDAEKPNKFKVPISGIETDVIAELLELSEAQLRMFSKIVEQAKKLGVSHVSRMGALGTSESNPNQRAYTLQTLINGITEDAQGAFPLIDRVERSEGATISSLRSKLIHLGRSGMMDWDATNTIPELPVEELLVGGRLSVLDVSETDDRSRNIAIAYTLQSLFEKVIATDVGEKMPSGRIRPKVLVVIEEVHTFVSKSTAVKMQAVLDNLQIISRRGRKRWMGLALVSQQPGHVPDELFELANTRFIHQLKSVANLDPVKRTTGGVHEALWSSVPALGPGQCLVSGAVFKNPLFVNIRPAKSKRLLTS